jgi:hypothetical protein
MSVQIWWQHASQCLLTTLVEMEMELPSARELGLGGIGPGEPLMYRCIWQITAGICQN